MSRHPAFGSQAGLVRRSICLVHEKPTRAIVIATACQCIALLGTRDCYAGFPQEEVSALLAGPVVGSTFKTGSPALLHAGLEASLVHFNLGNGIWYGGYADALYTVDRSRFSLGPEVGFTFGGVDGGLLIGDDGELGFTIRPLLSVALLSVYYRYGQYLTTEESFHALGLMIKLPLLKRAESRWESPF